MSQHKTWEVISGTTMRKVGLTVKILTTDKLSSGLRHSTHTQLHIQIANTRTRDAYLTIFVLQESTVC